MIKAPEMDYTKATKRQLYYVATDPTVEMPIRYEAVRELQKRRGEKTES